jgi:hypothetical protein
MSDEYSTKTKTDVLDLIINFLMEHEKQLDQMMERLESLIEILTKGSDEVKRTQAIEEHMESPSKSFKLNINNPGSFERMRALKIEWGDEKGTTADVRI